MTNVLNFTNAQLNKPAFNPIHEFNVGAVGMLLPIEIKLRHVKDVSMTMLNDGMSKVSVSFYLNEVTARVYNGLVLPMESLTDLTVRTAIDDDSHWSFLSYIRSLRTMKEVAEHYENNGPMPKYLTSLEVSTYDIDDTGSSIEWCKKLEKPVQRDYSDRCTLNDVSVLRSQQLAKMIGNIEELVRVNGGFVSDARSDDDEYALVMAFIPYTGKSAIQITLLFDGTIEPV